MCTVNSEKMFFGIIILFVTPTLGARILGIVPIPSYSHQIVFRPLWRELSLRGHQVTVMTTDPMNDHSLTNLTEIDLQFSYRHVSEMSMVNTSQKGIVATFNEFFEKGNIMLEEQLLHPKVQELLQNDRQFDLVLAEIFAPVMYAFAEKFKCPLIGIASMDASSVVHATLGNPAHPVLNPDYMLPFTGSLSFFERLASSFFALFMEYYFHPTLFNLQQSLVYKHFGDHYPLLMDIFRNTSLLFINVNPIFHQIRPLVPAVIPIGGGTHLTAPKALPKDLQEQLDGASNGFIYFSLGSNVKSKQLSKDIRDAILETFAELPYLVLWKFEQEDLQEKSGNVVISKWFPQQDIFRHPKIKLFITQGGLQSMEEAIYSHVPLVGMPFVGDQPMNIIKMVEKGFGLSVDYATLDKESFKKTILEVINNPKYRNKVKELAELARDQPMTGLQCAIWWTEYVLRHKGARHLRSPAMDLPSYQYYLLDVISFCLVVITFVIFLIVAFIKLALKFIKYLVCKRKLKVQ